MAAVKIRFGVPSSTPTTFSPSSSSRRRRKRILPSSSLPLPSLLIILVAFMAPGWRGSQAALFQGCDFGDELCDPGEVCIPDGLFGQCYSDPEAALIRPLILDRALSDAQSELLRTELGRLAEDGLDWPAARAQCVLAYFKLAVAFQLDYDQDFCSVRDPANIWALVQRVQNALLAEEEQTEEKEEEEEEDLTNNEGKEEEEEGNNNADSDVDIDEGQSLLTVGEIGGGEEGEEEDNNIEGKGDEEEEVELIPVILLEPNEEQQAQPVYELANDKNNNKTKTNKANDGNGKESSMAADKRIPPQIEGGMSTGEQSQLDELLHKMLANSRRPSADDAGTTDSRMMPLSDGQLTRLVQFVRQLQNLLEANVVERVEEAERKEEEEMQENDIGIGNEEEPVLLLKKDSEQFDNADMGLAHTVHKIVKGGIQRVEGNRVYLRVAKENLTEEELYKLIAYLDRKIAAPNRLYFDQFLYQDGQLSFRISRPPPSPETKTKLPKLGSASGVAQAVYKRRKDIQTLAGVRVDETGIGSGKDVVPLKRSQRDQLFLPILAVCGLTICALLSVLAASLISRRRRKAIGTTLLPQTVDQVDGKLYEQLCREKRGAAVEGPRSVAVIEAGQRSKHSSTSSWPEDEAAPMATDLDISTGHVLLTFLQKHLEQPEEMTKQWESVRDYAPQEVQTLVAERAENMANNLDQTVLPYDDSRVKLHENGQSLIEMMDYVNASKIYDSNPEYPAYIAAQAPLESTVGQFWQMIWEQGIGLVVNLCDQQETISAIGGGIYCKYWPEEGSKQFGTFEVHLVSEHIWSEHYVVRSLYLKNTGTQETRTVTQFHFYSWPAAGVPGSNKALLEFRRKVNKSYRGRASPVLVHCTNGGGRTGTYILIDMTTNRIQKGVKELNIAASLEHLRDQRMGTVENEQQFKCVFSCVADEISLLLKGLQH